VKLKGFSLIYIRKRMIDLTKSWKQLEQWQPSIVKLLKNIRINDRIAHAYLFTGAKGTGKRDVGLLFAKSLFCENPINGYEPCEKCMNCKRINHQNHPDVHILEPDGNSIKKDQIKALQQEFAKKSVESTRKFYMIHHADKMTPNAANSLLKFLEEPSSHTTAILMTENIHQILPTILSRCQILKFTPLPKKEMISLLIESGIRSDRAPLLASMTNSVEEAIHLGNDDWFAQARKVMLKLYEVLSSQNLLDALLYIQHEMFNHFKDRHQIDQALDLLLFIYRDLLYIQLGREGDLIFKDQLDYLQTKAIQTSADRLSDQMAFILEAKKKLQSNMNAQLLMEQLLQKLS